jgi:hypothetical protein
MTSKKISHINFFRSILPLCCLYIMVWHTPLSAQIFNGNMWLTSQEAIDQFPATYPNVRRITGRLVIGRADTVNLSNIRDLTPLSQLEYAQFIYISNNGVLRSLHGLEKMDTAYTLVVYHNPMLQDLYGLKNFRHVDGLKVQDNDSLTDLRGLERLQTASGSVSIDLCDRLVSLRGLDSLTRAPYGVLITRNPRLKTIQGLNRFEYGQLSVTVCCTLAIFRRSDGAGQRYGKTHNWLTLPI